MRQFEGFVQVTLSDCDTKETWMRSYKVRNLHFASIHDPNLIAAALMDAELQVGGGRHGPRLDRLPWVEEL